MFRSRMSMFSFSCEFSYSAIAFHAGLYSTIFALTVAASLILTKISAWCLAEGLSWVFGERDQHLEFVWFVYLAALGRFPRLLDLPLYLTLSITCRFTQVLTSILFKCNARVYSPLNQLANTFRLLKICPGLQSDEIRCYLVSTSPQTSVYEALSYKWGDSRFFRSILVNDKRFFVTQELSVTLLALRYQSKARMIWIDAISINQQDKHERTIQVQNMYSVYQHAQRVIVWLGCPTDHGFKDPFGDMRRLRNPRHPYFDWFQGSKNLALRSWILFGTGIEWNHDLEVYRGLENMLNSGWWRRVWVIQEIAAASRVVFHYGPHEVEWEDLYAVIRRLEIQIWPQFPNTVSSFTNIPIPAHWFMSQDFLQPLKRKNSIREYSLLELAHMFRDREATDSRDKLYGLLGLVSCRVDRGITPDYSKPAPLLYMETFKRHLSLHRNLFVLSLAEYRGKYDNVLPTWCCDWTVQTTRPIPFWKNNWNAAIQPWQQKIHDKAHQIYRAAGDTKMELIYPRHLAILGLRGFVLDEVHKCGNPWSSKTVMLEEEDENSVMLEEINESLERVVKSRESSNKASMIARESMRHANQTRRSLHGSAARFSQEDPFNVEADWCRLVAECLPNVTEFEQIHSFLETKTAGMYPDAKTGELKDVQSLWGKAETSFRALSDDGQTSKVLRYVTNAACSNRRLITTKGQRVGLGPVPTTSGDLVCIFLGADVPFILRRREKDHYQVIGQAYIHGSMFRTKESILRDINTGDIILQQFLLV